LEHASVEAAVADAHRKEWAFVLAASVRITGDIDLAEECVQDAYARALASWTTTGIPSKPGAWLTTVARRRAIDVVRRGRTEDRALPLLVEPVTVVGPDEWDEPDIADDRLRLIFTCCHPAIALDAQVALTLRLVCGLTTGEVGRAFLVSESTMAARLTRAKKKIALARIPYRVPAADELPARIDAVLTVLHLLYSTGHTAPEGADLTRRELVERSLDLARLLRTLLPDDAGVAGLLALMLLTDARRETRLGSDNQLVLLADQDRSRWDRGAIEEGVALVREALSRHPPGRFALMAAIAAVHDEATSWGATDSPVVALNRAVALGLALGPDAGLAALDELATEPVLATYSYLASARADFLRRLGRAEEARVAYEEAILLCENEVERAFLIERLSQVAG
jgi:RNA polymerase sigma-70 factor (ECF subfamily)